MDILLDILTNSPNVYSQDVTLFMIKAWFISKAGRKKEAEIPSSGLLHECKQQPRLKRQANSQDLYPDLPYEQQETTYVSHELLPSG